METVCVPVFGRVLQWYRYAEPKFQDKKKYNYLRVSDIWTVGWFIFVQMETRLCFGCVPRAVYSASLGRVKGDYSLWSEEVM